MKERRITTKFIWILLLILFIVEVVFYAVAYHQIHYKNYDQVVDENSGNVGGVVDQEEITQTFYYEGDYLSKILLKVGTFQRKNEGRILITLSEAMTKEIVFSKELEVSRLKDNSDIILQINSRLSAQDNQYCISIVDEGSRDNTAITMYYNDSDIHKGRLTVDGKEVKAELEMSIYGDTSRKLGEFYWLVAISILIFVFLACFIQKKQEEKGRNVLLHRILETIYTYKFMGKQLISRDFKTKYKRSVLGMLWSLLNPLLTMAVQYVVFSTIFRSDINNYPVYLLSASILFNFFTESVGGGLVSIVGNGSLIKKVNAPKYIYPLTKVLSTGINLLISLIPLLVVVVMTGEKITVAYILTPFVLLCLLVFCIGMSLIMSSLMVFFRDVQFLWGILSLLWMYATPMFYPASIIPDRFKFVLTWNPMYHYITFFRTIIMDCVSPQLSEYVWCACSSILILIIGALIFNKLEKKFILYL